MMSQPTPDASADVSEKLSEIFARINMSELPAMASHVTELISLTTDGRSSATELAEIILKDYSLTNKVLQVVNSAYYALPQPVTSITRAITHLGFDAIRDLAIPIALFEDFIKSGVEKEGITRILSCSFLSAQVARGLVLTKDLKVPAEEVFVCTLLRNLGKMIVCLYFPDLFRDIETRLVQGVPEDEASRQVLEGLTLSQVGIEVARFWNLSEKIIGAMVPDPPLPEAISEETGLLNNLADYANRLVDALALESDTVMIMEKYGPLFALDAEEVIALLTASMDAAEGLSNPVRYGLGRLRMRNKLTSFESAVRIQGMKASENMPSEALSVAPEPAGELSSSAALDEYLDSFMSRMTESLVKGEYAVNDFYARLLEGFCQGIGYDRALLALLKAQGGEMVLLGKLGYGVFDPVSVTDFRHDRLFGGEPINPLYVIPKSLRSCKDMAIPANTPNVFPSGLDAFVKDRNVFLLPICLKSRPLGLFYLDRRKDLPRPDNKQLSATRQLRDLAVLALRKKHGQEEK